MTVEAIGPAFAGIDDRANLLQPLRRWAAEDPERVIARARARDGFEDWSAGRVDARVRSLANGLVACGVEPGDRVALMAHTRLEWLLVDLAIMSAVPVELAGGYFSLDFTAGPDQAYGGSTSQQEISPGVWAMIAGDGNSDGFIDLDDRVEVWLEDAGGAGYLPGELNLDAQVGNGDKNDCWQPNLGKATAIPQSEKKSVK